MLLFFYSLMPEGPSIVILRESLEVFAGKTVRSVSGNAKIDLERIKGKKITGVKSWGKHFLISFDDFYLRIHLLMFGTYRIDEVKENEPRLRLVFNKGEFSFYACSVKLFEGKPEDTYDWRRDPMSDDWDPKLAFRTVVAESKEMICDVLLDQEIFSGVGNIIKNEVLFLAKVHPEVKVIDMPEKKLKEIVKLSREYCFDFLKWKRKFELKKNYRIYTKKVCPECSGKIILKHTGKRKRRSFFCEDCQEKFKKKKVI
jgi:endonuclease-8